MPTPLLVTRPPRQIRNSVARAVRIAKRCSQRFSVQRIIKLAGDQNLKKRAAAAKTTAARVPRKRDCSRSRRRFQLEVGGFLVIGAHGDVSCLLAGLLV